MRTFLFDYGGTLDTSATHWFYVFQKAYENMGLSITEPLLREAYVMGERTLAKERIIMPDDDFATMLSKKIKIQVEHLQALEILSLNNDAQKEQIIANLANYCDSFARKNVAASSLILSKLKGNAHLIIVSNFYGNLHAVLRSYGILHLFNEVIESAVVGVRKPDPAIWQLGVAASGLSAEDCIAVGDSFNKDIVPASSIGCQTVWFKGREWEDKTYNESIPTHIIHSLSELLKFYD